MDCTEPDSRIIWHDRNIYIRWFYLPFPCVRVMRCTYYFVFFEASSKKLRSWSCLFGTKAKNLIKHVFLVTYNHSGGYILYPIYSNKYIWASTLFCIIFVSIQLRRYSKKIIHAVRITDSSSMYGWKNRYFIQSTYRFDTQQFNKCLVYVCVSQKENEKYVL